MLLEENWKLPPAEYFMNQSIPEMLSHPERGYQLMHLLYATMCVHIGATMQQLREGDKKRPVFVVFDYEGVRTSD